MNTIREDNREILRSIESLITDYSISFPYGIYKIEYERSECPFDFERGFNLAKNMFYGQLDAVIVEFKTRKLSNYSEDKSDE